MLRVALTGGVGSGKTAAAAMLRELGAQVSNSDEIGRELMQPGQAVFKSIVATFGRKIVLPNGTLNRPALGRIAFDGGRLAELNAIVHPAVIAAQNRWMAQVAERDPLAVAIVESALIFETEHGVTQSPAAVRAAPWRTRFDRIVLVTAPLEMRRARFIARIGGNAAELSADFDGRTAAQWTDVRKAALSDFLIVNGGSFEALRTRVKAVYASLRAEAADRAAESM